MRRVFADTFYWVALLSDRDEYHAHVRKVSGNLGSFVIVTTHEVLGEVLTYFSGTGAAGRVAAGRQISLVLTSADAEVLPQTAESFSRGSALYCARPDKGYMEAMRGLGLREILSGDRHFEQEGFTLLL